jgi:hypothetical protein
MNEIQRYWLRSESERIVVSSALGDLSSHLFFILTSDGV